MKEQIISYLSTQRNDLYSLNKFIYDNPEESYSEHKSCEYICNFLSSRGFNIEQKYQSLDTSFFASKGKDHPKICFICEYDALKDMGHVTGHNLLTTTSIAAAIGLGSIIDKTGGSVHVIGCPGEYLGGSTCTFVRSGVFNDMDIVLMAHPDLVTSESGTSSAIIPLKVVYSGSSGLSFLNKDNYSSLDAILLTFNIINSLMSKIKDTTTISFAITNGGSTPLIHPKETEGQFYIRSVSMSDAKKVEDIIRETIKFVSQAMNLNSEISLFEPPSEELLTNITLSRLFCNNLKETGIIDIGDFRNITSGLSVGCVSQKVPTIHPFISITKDESIKYGTKEFGECTITDYALDQCIKSAIALSFTGLDIITNENLLSEVKSEFYDNNTPLY